MQRLWHGKNYGLQFATEHEECGHSADGSSLDLALVVCDQEMGKVL